MSTEPNPQAASVDPIVIPHCTDRHDVRIIKIAVCPKGEPVFSEQTTSISIDDEAAGEYVKVMQEGGHTDIAKWIAVDPDEWVTLRDSIDFMIDQCRSE